MLPPRSGPYREPELHVDTSYALGLTDGSLCRSSVGWSRHPRHVCNLDRLDRDPKRWNYWCLTGPEHLVAVSVSDRGSEAVAAMSVYRFADRMFRTAVAKADDRRFVSMSSIVDGDVTFANGPTRFAFRGLGRGRTSLSGVGRLDDETPFSFDFEIHRPAGHETLNVVIPWSDTEYQFTSKHECLRPKGRLDVGRSAFSFTPDACYATFDFGRGYWPHESIWNWAAASGRQQGHVIGLNLGGKWTDGTGTNENGVLIDGRLHKIGEDLVWDYDPTDFMKPWRILTPHSDTLDLTFDPAYERRDERSEADGSYRRAVSQVFGHFAGTVPGPSGPMSIQELFGWAEELQATW